MTSCSIDPILCPPAVRSAPDRVRVALVGRADDRRAATPEPARAARRLGALLRATARRVAPLGSLGDTALSDRAVSELSQRDRFGQPQ